MAGVKPEDERGGGGAEDDFDWSEEHDSLPLKLRLKTLLAKRSGHGPAPSPLVEIHQFQKKETEDSFIPPPVVVKKEDGQCDLLEGYAQEVSGHTCFPWEEGNEKPRQEESHNGLLGEKNFLGTERVGHVISNGIKVNEVTGSVIEEKVNARLSSLSSCITLSESSFIEEAKYEDDTSRNHQGNGLEGSLDFAGKTAKVKSEFAYDFLDGLDHLVLKERRRLLLFRKSLELTKPVPEGTYSCLANREVGDKVQHNLETAKKENSLNHAESSSIEHDIQDVIKSNAYDICKISKSSSSNGNILTNGKSKKICLSLNASTISQAQDLLSGIHDKIFSSVPSPISLNVKAEPVEYDGVPGLNKGTVCTYVSNGLKLVKRELLEDSDDDKIDHILLRDRIKLASKATSNVSRISECSNKIVPPDLYCSPIASQSTECVKINRPRKRRKTVTDSVETAMEEDAPGLLKVLIDKGVSVNEIKLYGVGENDAAPDNSLDESFSELEAVISKLFFQRRSLLNMASIRCTKDEKASYCLACLISLVEQARYLQFRKWPVEWGWCRDLQSFIFVFRRHNRIVLERPEYGYATYFFELVDCLTVDWQIQRLVTSMKLSNCGRITLIENKALVVGEDLTEGEAKVLMEYGWIPDSGLGTMLNYCDRVVHDRKNENDSAEWRSKIGKLLMAGYNGGTIVPPHIPTKVVEFSGSQDPQVKLEI